MDNPVVWMMLAVCVIGGLWELYMMTCRTDQWLAIKRHKAEMKRKQRADTFSMLGRSARTGFSIARWFIK